VTQRRWLAFCNPPLRQLISTTLGSEAWIRYGQDGALAFCKLVSKLQLPASS